MNRREAATRLGVPEHAVTSVVEHPAGHLASLRSGVVMLVAATVARAYVPEVDDVASGVVGEDGPELVELPAGAEVAAKPKAAKRKTSGGSGS